ncbi:MAG: hypothetical protein IIC57_09985 [Proteobacteria bacterium]|nr:hypothetical protein [Pseudomonadota bacterium]
MGVFAAALVLMLLLSPAFGEPAPAAPPSRASTVGLPRDPHSWGPFLWREDPDFYIDNLESSDAPMPDWRDRPKPRDSRSLHGVFAPDPVGTLPRLLENITGGSTRPPLRISAWDPSERSTWNAEGSRMWLDINKNFPLYQSFKGMKPYVAETAILELCKPKQGEPMDARQYVEHVDLMLTKWMGLGNRENDG